MMRQMEAEMSAAFDEAKQHVRKEVDAGKTTSPKARSPPRQPASKIMEELD